MSAEATQFIDTLHKEKEIHKEHRHRHVIQKLILSASFVGLSQIAKVESPLHVSLYIAPLVALVHDLYIFAEDYKVKRIGLFILHAETPAVSELERQWERDWLGRFREKLAYWASFAYSGLILILCAGAGYIADVRPDPKGLYTFWLTWLVTCTVVLGSVFIYGKLLENKICAMATAAPKDASPRRTG